MTMRIAEKVHYTVWRGLGYCTIMHAISSLAVAARILFLPPAVLKMLHYAPPSQSPRR